MFKKDADVRKSQINTLKVFNANVIEIAEGQEYQIAFRSGSNDLVLHIVLGKDFPKERPKLRISPVVSHPWVNNEGDVTTAPGLLNFTVHSDLGRVVQAITREFERTPPPLLGNHSNGVSSAIPILNGENRTSPNFSTLPIISSFSPPTRIATQSNQFPQLNTMSIEELQFLNTNLDRQQEFVEELPYMIDQSKVLDDCITHIEEMATGNMSKQEQMETLKTNIDEKIDEVTQLVLNTERLHSIYQGLSEKFSPRNIQDQLKVAASEAELEGEKIAEEFLNGEMDVDRFVNRYLHTRKLCQLRKSKEEKLGHQLDSLERAGF